MKFRRVVTGHNSDGDSRVASDVVCEPDHVLPSGASLNRLWAADDMPSYPDAGEPLPAEGWFAPPGGFRFFVYTLPPGEFADYHESDTADLIYVAAGQIELGLDTEKIVLSAGDTLVQSGTRHSWFNPGSETCVLIVTLIGASRND